MNGKRFAIAVLIAVGIIYVCFRSWIWYRNARFVGAARRGDIVMVRNLLNSGADVNARDISGVTAIQWAAFEGHKTTVELLIDHHADASIALYEAALGKRQDIVTMLLARHIDINARDHTGGTILIWAARGGGVDVLKMLLAHGADTSLRDKKGKTALQYATENDNKEAAELLRQAGAKE